MSKPTKAQVTAARKLLEKQGYTVAPPPTPIQIGDIVECVQDGLTILITMKDTNACGFTYGGTLVGEVDYIETAWIEDEEYANNPKAYKLLGHINLSKALTP